MKKLFIVPIIFALGVLSTGFFGLETKNWSDPREYSYGIGTETNTFCSATKVSPTQLLTAAHCISDTQEFAVWKGNSVVGHAILEKRTIQTDLALLTIKDGVEGNYASLAAQEGLQDEIAIAVGYPLGQAEIVTEGVLQGLREYRCFMNTAGDGFCTQAQFTTVPATFGNSGGGLFVYRNWHWQLIGVGSAVMGQGFSVYNNLSIFVSLANIKGLIDGSTGAKPEENQESTIN